ncbi:putative PapG_C domain-containing protein [Vibrio jasicida]|uniref:PapG chaperone-binding domain-containing protein n=1 Tax=Vibrio jasicida TaxID=766224 RepID=UPI0028942AA0|nr:putative PapG_C domain-containing protein [Vibrio jasicida]
MRIYGSACKFICLFCSLLVFSTNVSARDNTFRSRTIWHYQNVNETSKEIEVSFAGATVNLPNASVWAWGNPRLVQSQCDGSQIQGTRTVNERTWIAYPESVQINGKTAPISVSPNPQLISNYQWIQTGYTSSSKTTSQSCPSVGNVWQGTDYPNINSGNTSATIKIPSNLAPNKYIVPIVLKAAMDENAFGAQATPYSPWSIYEIANITTSPNPRINLIVNVRNSCTFSTSDINLDHGRLVLGEADGNTTQKPFSINCTAPANAKLSIVNSSAPIENIPNQVRIGLGSGWDSILSINDKSNENDFVFDLNQGGNVFEVKSTLAATSSPKEGSLSGFATISVEIF